MTARCQTGADALFARLYDRAFSWDATSEVERLVKLARLPSDFDGRVLDIGAGTGRIVVPLLDRELKCLCVEPDAAMVAILHSRTQRYGLSNSILHARFEDIDFAETFDFAVAVTDVLSYVWPAGHLRRFLKKLHDALSPRGVAVLDVALWGAYHGEERHEDWKLQIGTEWVDAACDARVELIEGCGPVRVETLTFSSATTGAECMVTRQRLLHAFTFPGLRATLGEYGLRVDLAHPSDLLDAEVSVPRALLAVRRAA